MGVERGSEHLLAHSARLVGLQRLLLRPAEHLILVDRGQPERRHLIVVVAVTMAVALNYWICPELLQTRAGRDQILTETAVVIDRGLQW